MNKLTKFFSLAVLSTALFQQVFAQGNYAPNNSSDQFSRGRPSNNSYVQQGSRQQSYSYGQQQGSAYGQQGNAYGQQGNAYGQQGNAYGQQGNAYGQQGNAYGQKQGNIVDDPDNAGNFGAPDERFEQRNAEFRKYADSQCPGSMHFTQPNHPAMAPTGNQGQ